MAGSVTWYDIFYLLQWHSDRLWLKCSNNIWAHLMSVGVCIHLLNVWYLGAFSSLSMSSSCASSARPDAGISQVTTYTQRDPTTYKESDATPHASSCGITYPTHKKNYTGRAHTGWNVLVLVLTWLNQLIHFTMHEEHKKESIKQSINSLNCQLMEGWG